MKDLITVVVPCYNEEKALPLFLSRLTEVLAEMREIDYRILLVDDGSRDGTKELIREAARKDERIRYLIFSRNFGKEAAISAGLSRAEGDYIVLMDADLQDPPSLIPDMYDAVKNGGYDCAATRRKNRKGEPKVRSAFAHLFYGMMRRQSNAEIVDGARDFRLMTRQYAEAVLSLGEYNRFSKGIFGWIGFRTKWFAYDNVERVAGKTKWSFFGLVRYAFEGLTAFSTAPLTFSSLVGIFMCLLSVIFIIFIIVRKLIFGDPVAGWPSMVCIISFIGGIQLLALGIQGQYLAKMYLEVKKRPLYIIAEDSTDPQTEESRIAEGYSAEQSGPSIE